MNFKKALMDPSSFYNHPQDIVKDDDLSRDQKIQLLRRWEYDARDMLVATEEGMEGQDNGTLEAVLKALKALDAGRKDETGAPTKQGGD